MGSDFAIGCCIFLSSVLFFMLNYPFCVYIFDHFCFEQWFTFGPQNAIRLGISLFFFLFLSFTFLHKSFSLSVFDVFRFLLLHLFVCLFVFAPCCVCPENGVHSLLPLAFYSFYFVCNFLVSYCLFSCVSSRFSSNQLLPMLYCFF